LRTISPNKLETLTICYDKVAPEAAREPAWVGLRPPRAVTFHSAQTGTALSSGVAHTTVEGS